MRFCQAKRCAMAELHAPQMLRAMLAKTLAGLANKMRVVAVASQRDSWAATA
jgi:hypothetical protein